MKILKKLEDLKSSNFLEEYQGLKEYVINDLIEKEKEDANYGAKGYLKDLSQGGCQSGMVNSLIYYEDTEEFYNNYASEIDQLKEYIEELNGEILKIKGNTRNFLAWLAYEEIAFLISEELELLN
jgi:hypothetical protein